MSGDGIIRGLDPQVLCGMHCMDDSNDEQASSLVLTRHTSPLTLSSSMGLLQLFCTHSSSVASDPLSEFAEDSSQSSCYEQP